VYDSYKRTRSLEALCEVAKLTAIDAYGRLFRNLRHQFVTARNHQQPHALRF